MPNINEDTPVYIIKQTAKQLPEPFGKLIMTMFEHPEMSLRIHMAPAHASRSWNYAFQGGLVQSIADRCQWVDKLTDFLGQCPNTGPISLKHQLLICVLLQDLFCVGDTYGNQHFIPNILKSGKTSVAEPFTANPECHLYQITGNKLTSEQLACATLLLNVRNIREDGDLSLALINAYGGALYNHLTPEMILAIRCRHGLYGKNNFIMKGKENYLLIALNFLNLWSSRTAREDVKEENAPPVETGGKIKI